MNDATATELGLAIVTLLNLKPLREYKKDPGGDRYATDHGSKTLSGLGRTVARIVDYHKQDEITNDEAI